MLELNYQFYSRKSFDVRSIEFRVKNSKRFDENYASNDWLFVASFVLLQYFLSWYENKGFRL